MPQHSQFLGHLAILGYKSAYYFVLFKTHVPEPPGDQDTWPTEIPAAALRESTYRARPQPDRPAVILHLNPTRAWRS